ncbi:hypothetical protein BH11PLA2_BH11PLA2_43430 [soil metagenome]
MACKREQFWRQRVMEQQASELTVLVYYEQHHLREPSFYFWRRTLGERDRATAATRVPCFVPVEVPTVPASPVSHPAFAAVEDRHAEELRRPRRAGAGVP